MECVTCEIIGYVPPTGDKEKQHVIFLLRTNTVEVHRHIKEKKME